MAVNVFFLRVSSTSQQLESQFDEVWEYYSKVDNLDRESIRVIEYKESGVKLSEEERLGITDLKQLAETEGVDTIYCSELSRIARTEKVLWSFVEYLEQNKIQLKCKNPEFCLLNDDRTMIPFNSRLMVSTFGTLATQEAIEKKRRFARGKSRKAKEGKYNGGAIPFGYRIDTEHDNLIVIDEGGEADIVREIYNLYENGMSQPKIARELMQRGVKGRAARATKNFTISLVHQILTNKLLTGAANLNKGSSYERTYPMIITPEQFERCRKIAEANNTKAPKALRVYYAHHLLKCVECGRYFVSTGNKGYYHCWDAYYPNRDINGYGDVPRCQNKVCISTNIMDSLLWELTKDYESTFILNDAQRKLEECEKAKLVLTQKLDAIPNLKHTIDERLDRLYEAYADGMKKENYLSRKRALQTESKAIEASEAQYKEQLSKYDALIEDIKKNMDIDLDLNSEESIDAFIEKSDSVWNRVAAITDDEERSRLIHKHIEKVELRATTINYKFGNHPEGKETFAKEIIVYTYISNPRTFIFVPYNGKGGIMLEKNDNAGEMINLPTDSIPSLAVPEYTPFDMEYLPRIIDKGKRKRREIERAKREGIKSLGTEKLRREGYISMNEMREESKLSYSTLYNAIRDGKMPGTNMYKTWYVKKKDFKAYLKKYNPKPRPYRQITSVVHLSDIQNQKTAEEKLLEAIGFDIKEP